MSLSDPFETLQTEIGDSLEGAAIAYLRTGLWLFHQTRKKSETNQAAVGNLCIAVEILLKTLIARKAFSFIYSNLPLEAHVFVSYPATRPDAAGFRHFAIDLRSFQYKTRELDECISLFYGFFPAEKQEFRTYFKLLSAVRNRSVHAALPAFQTYDLHRVAHLALKLVEYLKKEGTLNQWTYLLTKDDREFVGQYDAARLERVERLIDAAKKKSKELGHTSAGATVDHDWNVITTPCPVCGCDGVLEGYTEPEEWSGEDASLDFYADTFECHECGLKLNDVEELKIAGMDIVYERNNDWDQWMQDSYDDEYG